MAALVLEHGQLWPGIEWEPLQRIDFEAEQAWLRGDWFEPLIERAPPRYFDTRALLFGLRSTPDLYVLGRRLFEVDADADWAAYGKS